MRQKWAIADQEIELDVQREGDTICVTVGGRTIKVTGHSPSPGVLHLSVDGRPVRAITALDQSERHLAVGGARLVAARVTGGRKRRRDQAAAGGLTSPMPGQVLKVLVKAGDAVEKGATVMIIEAMKMEHAIRAPHAGTVLAVHFGEGEMVTPGAALAEVAPISGEQAPG